jgi:hypothetical protein
LSSLHFKGQQLTQLTTSKKAKVGPTSGTYNTSQENKTNNIENPNSKTFFRNTPRHKNVSVSEGRRKANEHTKTLAKRKQIVSIIFMNSQKHIHF